MSSKLEKKVKVLEEQLEDLTNTKLYYKRNADLNQEKDKLEKRVSELEEICNKDQALISDLKMKIKSEQDMIIFI